jgi:hypothetical protein
MKEAMTNNHEEVFEAINVSLKKLSTSANNVKENGTQLYKLLFQEMYLHHKAMLNQNNDNKTVSTDGPSNEAVNEVKKVESGANAKIEKSKMYFGESPLDYVSHQK